ncbi:DNA helicase-2/ATP-dependent DNA helicase PcrA [Solirubrobacter pauli]|uniref:DNA 3'-5' helicase n=1 Tax=Solirubrobacter pauli TaxID=166793 RepID=A0A660KXK6_9ACTN|nr:ATP-dependent helicase [Solirubrobacter pauli]RKQ86447.1 DNA helicase-2/ATP-dependent DNA helicase PcrA [Solirubrobacter pauli]
MAVLAETSERHWLEELNDEQRAAATHTGGPLLILAGAGTGKTTTLCARVAWLVAEGVPSERILLLTFTRRASREMLQRARGLVPASSRVLGGTFHSVAHRLVRRHAAALGLPGGFGVLDAGDAADVLDLLREEAGHAKARTRFPKKGTLLDIYSRTVNAQQPLSGVIAEHFPWVEDHREAISALFREYTARKKSLGVIDLDDLLLMWRALARDEVIGPRLASSFDHVLIDEYQDVNGLQVDLAQALGGFGCDVTAVGDDFQAIYGFRSASAGHILDFPEHFPGTRVVTLERNYRSTQPVLDAANELAAQATRAFPKRLRADRPGGVRPRVVHIRDEAAQAEEVANRVLEARENGSDLRDQAVLARTSHDSDALELELLRRKIPYVKYGGLKYLEAAHVKDFVALLRLADNGGDDIAWFRVLQLVEGLGPASARKAMAVMAGDDARGAGEPSEAADAGGAATRRGLSASARDEAGEGRLAAVPDRLAAWPAAREVIPSATRASADALIAALAVARDEQRAGPRAEGLREVLAPLVKARYPDGGVRVQDLDQLVAAAHQANDPRHFVAELVLDPPQSSADLAQPPHLDEDYLTLSTIHSAKGLEWDHVHVLAVYDGNFPADMAAGTSEQIDEERRLLYVGMTRARRTLSMYVPVRYHHRPRGFDDAHGYGKPSRFLTPEVLACCDVTRLPDDPLNPRGAPIVTARRLTVSPDSLFD